MAQRSLFTLMALAVATPAFGVTVANPSFESPPIDPQTNPFLAIPFVDSWTAAGAENTTGTFHNTTPGHTSQVTGNPDYITNLDQLQGAFISGSQGTAISQLLGDVYTAGSSYTLTAGIAVSGSFAPYADPAKDQLELAFFYMKGLEPVNVGTPVLLDTSTLSATSLVDFSVSTPVVNPGDAWANQPIGIAIRAVHPTADVPQGYWDVDNVRVTAAAVPEPASLGVLALGGAAMLWRRRARA